MTGHSTGSYSISSPKRILRPRDAIRKNENNIETDMKTKFSENPEKREVSKYNSLSSEVADLVMAASAVVGLTEIQANALAEASAEAARLLCLKKNKKLNLN